MNLVQESENKIKSGKFLSRQDAVELYNYANTEEFLLAAGKLAKAVSGRKVDLCSIMNAKSGRCSENCKYCAQSVHYETGATQYSLVKKDDALLAAKQNEKIGVKRFSLVTSGNSLSHDEFETVLEIVSCLKKETNLVLCASLGAINLEQAKELKIAGLKCYHHNVETSRNHFANICTTHSYDNRIATISEIKNSGLDICSGGIIGLGESVEDRISMAIELREMGIKNIPLNFLTPVKGTPLENSVKIQTIEALKTIAIFRFILPDAVIRFAAGRSNFGEDQWKGFDCGINAMMVGNFLTTSGSSAIEDLEKLKVLGFEY